MIKKFSQYIKEAQKMSFMDIVRGSGGNLPDEAEVVGSGHESKLKPYSKPVPIETSKSTSAFDFSKYQLDDEEPVKSKPHDFVIIDDGEPVKRSRSSKPINQHIGLSVVNPGIKELLGKKLFIEYQEAKKLLNKLTVKDFLQSELRDLKKGMKYLKGSHLSGAKTKERLLLAKIEDAEDFDGMEETKTQISMTIAYDALISSNIDAMHINKNPENLTMKFIIPEEQLEDFKEFLNSIGASPAKDKWGPVERWYSGDDVEWRMYKPEHGIVQIASAFLKESKIIIS